MKTIFIDIGSVKYFERLLSSPAADAVLDKLLDDLKLDDDAGAEYEAREREEKFGQE